MQNLALGQRWLILGHNLSRLILADPSRLDVAVQILLERMVHRHLMIFPALLVEPQPPALTLRKIIFNPHGERRADAREAVNQTNVRAKRAPIEAAGRAYIDQSRD